MSDLPVIFDAAAVLPVRVTTYLGGGCRWPGGGGVASGRFRGVDREFGEWIIAGLRALPGDAV